MTKNLNRVMMFFWGPYRTSQPGVVLHRPLHPCAAISILVATLVSTACSGNDGPPRHDGAGVSDQADTFAATLKQQYGITIDRDAAVDIADVACEAPTEGVGLYDAQKKMQQRYPDNTLNTIATIMSAGVLAYCPGRLQ